MRGAEPPGAQRQGQQPIRVTRSSRVAATEASFAERILREKASTIARAKLRTRYLFVFRLQGTRYPVGSNSWTGAITKRSVIDPDICPSR